MTSRSVEVKFRINFQRLLYDKILRVKYRYVFAGNKTKWDDEALDSSITEQLRMWSGRRDVEPASRNRP